MYRVAVIAGIGALAVPGVLLSRAGGGCGPSSGDRESPQTPRLPLGARCSLIAAGPLSNMNEQSPAEGRLGGPGGRLGAVDLTGPGGRPVVVLVTGGAGFVGQHVVRVLQERARGVREIRVLDTQRYENKLGHKEVCPVRVLVGDVSCVEEVRCAVRGVDAVIHTAGLVSSSVHPDLGALHRVNVRGTAYIIQACVEHNVPTLVYTSTVDVVIGGEEIHGGDESLPPPRTFLFPGYPQSKHQAERLVVEANGRKLANGGALHTVALRPCVLYGELDPHYVTAGLRAAAARGGVLPRVGDGSALFQQAYVGNAAWAHLCALAALRRGGPGGDKGGGVGGRAYFVTDRTPLMNTFEFMRPFLAARHCRLSDHALPYPLAYAACWALAWALWALTPLLGPLLGPLEPPLSLASLVYINHTLYFSGRTAEELLGYRPIHDWVSSLDRSLAYYRTVPL